MKHYTKQITKLLLTGFLSLILVACDNEERLNYFNHQISKSIKGKNSVVVNVRDLTNFEWDRVCFEMYYGYFGSESNIMLNFYTKNSGKEVVESFELSLNNYYLNKTYTETAPKCLYSNEKLLLINTIYDSPNNSKRIHFLMPTAKHFFGINIEEFL